MASSVTVTVVNETIIGPAVTSFPAIGTDVIGGFEVTGFIEVEKTISFVNSFGVPRTLFLEKKLPFQTFLLDIDPK
jgi:hypothetical protein